MEPPTAGKAEDRANDFTAGLYDPPLHGLEVGRVDDHQRATGAHLLCSLKAAAQPPIGKAGVIGPVVLEGPAEGGAVEPLGVRHALDGELDVVDAAIVLGVCHNRLPEEQQFTTEDTEGSSSR